MKKINVEKVVQYKGFQDKDIANTIISLAAPLLNACGDDHTLKELLISLTITGWNLSLFPEENSNYKSKIITKLPKHLPEEKKKVFTSFVMQVINKKQADFSDIKKGIKSYTLSFERGKICLNIKALPVHPDLIKG